MQEKDFYLYIDGQPVPVSRKCTGDITAPRTDVIFMGS